MNSLKENREMNRFNWLLASLIITMTVITTSDVYAKGRSFAGVLVCATEDSWSAIISAKKRFQCTFASNNGEVRGKYSGEIRSFSLDVEKTGDTVLMWQVSGPPEKIGENYEPGGLEGSYANAEDVSEEDLQLSRNALVGFGPRSFVLQPISVQVETGLSVAAGVHHLLLTYVGPILA